MERGSAVWLLKSREKLGGKRLRADKRTVFCRAERGSKLCLLSSRQGTGKPVIVADSEQGIGADPGQAGQPEEGIGEGPEGIAAAILECVENAGDCRHQFGSKKNLSQEDLGLPKNAEKGPKHHKSCPEKCG